MIVCKDILGQLKEAGYTTTRLRQEKIFGEGTLTKIRNSGNLRLDTLDKICKLTGKNITDLIEYRPD